MFPPSGKERCWKALIDRIITKLEVKNEKIQRKQAYSLCFVNGFKFQENNFKIVLIGNNNKKISWESHRSQWLLLDK